MQRLVELSGNDGLTGLPNRSWLLQRMPRIFDQVRDGGGSLTLALVDLDHFTRVNDDIGHLGAGARADLVVLDAEHEADLVAHLGVNPISRTIVGGTPNG